MSALISASDTLALLKNAAPLVHCISNQVAANDCANALLAIGASPIMADAPEEVAEVTAACRALALSLGTPSRSKADAMLLAGKQAFALDLPVVFDPVGVGMSDFRRNIAAQILSQVHPSILRCNASELWSLAMHTPSHSGVDASIDQYTLPQTAQLAMQFAQTHCCIVAVSGATDLVTDGNALYRLCVGTPLMRKITGCGCMLTALTAAFAATVPQHLLEASIYAAGAMGLCGSAAAARMRDRDGTGSLRVYLIDALSCLTPDALQNSLKIEEITHHELH